jgi:uncharacterized sodium:solute symporter family permease YidK
MNPFRLQGLDLKKKYRLKEINLYPGTILMLTIGRFWPLETPFQLLNEHFSEAKPWRGRWLIYGVLLLAMIAAYAIFSKLVLVK